MINRLMISVAAAALIAGTGFANAQGTGMKHEAPRRRRAAERAAERWRAVRARNADGEHEPRWRRSPDMKATQTEQKSPAPPRTSAPTEDTQGPKAEDR